MMRSRDSKVAASPLETDDNENDFEDGRDLANCDYVKGRSTEMESTLECPTSICVGNESGIEQTLAKASSSVGKSQWKKQKARHDALDAKFDNNVPMTDGEHSEKEVDLFLQPTVNNCSMKRSETIAEVSLSTKRRDKKSKHDVLGSDLDHDLTVSEGKHSERLDFEFAPEVAESNLETLKECKFDNNGAGTLSVEKVELKTYRREQSADQLENNVKQFEVVGARQFSDDAQIHGLLENEMKIIRVCGQALSMKGLELEEGSANYFEGALVCEESTKRNQNTSSELTACENEKDVTLQDTTEDNFEKEIKANGDKIKMMVHGLYRMDKSASHLLEKKDDTLSAYSKCELLEVKDAETETKMDENVPTFHHVGACKDLEDTRKDENVPKTLQSSPGSDYPVCTKKKLLILDLNGILVDIVQSDRCSSKAEIIISRKAVFKRPFCDEFLQFCFERFNVGVWSSRIKKNVDQVVDFLMGEDRHKLLFLWDQSHCTDTWFKTVENRGKPLLLKELKKLWEKVVPELPWEKGEYNESNTLLLDDSPYKTLRNPAHTAIFPNQYDSRNANDCSLGPGGDIRVYLEGLAAAENVQTYVQQNPFGQQPITESNPSWRFYQKVKNAEPY